MIVTNGGAAYYTLNPWFQGNISFLLHLSSIVKMDFIIMMHHLRRFTLLLLNSYLANKHFIFYKPPSSQKPCSLRLGPHSSLLFAPALAFSSLTPPLFRACLTLSLQGMPQRCWALTAFSPFASSRNLLTYTQFLAEKQVIYHHMR